MTYTTLDYLPDLTTTQMNTALSLSFSPYSVISVGWDNAATVSGSESYAILHDVYRFNAVAGATYDVFSTSYFDPYLLRIHDGAGNTIIANDEGDDPADSYLGDGYYSKDVIFNWVAPYTGTYFVQANWNQGSYYKYYSLSVYEDINTAAPVQPPITYIGTSGNDIVAGSKGNDFLNGGLGTDTAVYLQSLAAYTFTAGSAAGNNTLSGPEGVDTLTSIERLTFADANLAFDLEGNAGQTYRLYQAAFNRTPDLGGLGGWIVGRDNGLTPIQVANSFMASAEFQSLYGANPGNEQFVSLLYTNALHRPADASSLVYWVNQLATGLQTRAQVLVNFSESPENKASVLPSIANGILYANATQAAGPAKGQIFTGAASNDTFVGTVGNDTFNGGAGNDSINGGAGLDVAVYGGTRASHSIFNGAALTVSGGSDGTDTLSNVERLRFDDTALAFDTSGNAGQTYRLYQAAFNRTPDKGGLSDWIRGMDTGMSLQKVASGFVGSAEFKNLMGINSSDTQFVDLMYANVLHRAADQSGYNYWLGQMQGGTTRETVLIGFSESPENQAALIGVIQGGIEYVAV